MPRHPAIILAGAGAESARRVVLRCAAKLGIETLVDRLVGLGARSGAANAGRKAITLLYAMALGANSIEDCDVPRSGRTGALLGGRVAAPSTLETFFRAFTFGHVRQLDRVLAETLTRTGLLDLRRGSQRYGVSGARIRRSPDAGPPRRPYGRCIVFPTQESEQMVSQISFLIAKEQEADLQREARDARLGRHDGPKFSRWARLHPTRIHPNAPTSR